MAAGGGGRRPLAAACGPCRLPRCSSMRRRLGSHPAARQHSSAGWRARLAAAGFAAASGAGWTLVRCPRAVRRAGGVSDSGRAHPRQGEADCAAALAGHAGGKTDLQGLPAPLDRSSTAPRHQQTAAPTPTLTCSRPTQASLPAMKTCSVPACSAPALPCRLPRLRPRRVVLWVRAAATVEAPQQQAKPSPSAAAPAHPALAPLAVAETICMEGAGGFVCVPGMHRGMQCACEEARMQGSPGHGSSWPCEPSRVSQQRLEGFASPPASRRLWLGQPQERPVVQDGAGPHPRPGRLRHHAPVRAAALHMSLPPPAVLAFPAARCPFPGIRPLVRDGTAPGSSGRSRTIHWRGAATPGLTHMLGAPADSAPPLLPRPSACSWLPPPSQSVSPQGYLPGQLYNLKSKYGTEEELRALCADLLAAGIR